VTTDPMLRVHELVRMLPDFNVKNPLTLDRVPEVVSGEQRAAYAALAAQLYDKLDGPPEERSHSAPGQLASALWQRITEWDERAEDD
jgi:hypothetical protein